MANSSTYNDDDSVFKPVRTELPSSLVGLSEQAVYWSVAINPCDKFSDQVHYFIGMWGKLIILGAIKSQASKQEVDPDLEMNSLEWDRIFREIWYRTPETYRHYFTIGSVIRWYENRIRAYKEHFPLYYHYQSAIEHIIRHYSKQLKTLTESSEIVDINWKNFYWENLHTLKPGTHNVAQSSNVEVESRSNPFNANKLLPNAFCTVGVGTWKSGDKYSPTVVFKYQSDNHSEPQVRVGKSLRTGKEYTNEDEAPMKLNVDADLASPSVNFNFKIKTPGQNQIQSFHIEEISYRGQFHAAVVEHAILSESPVKPVAVAALRRVTLSESPVKQVAVLAERTVPSGCLVKQVAVPKEHTVSSGSPLMPVIVSSLKHAHPEDDNSFDQRSPNKRHKIELTIRDKANLLSVLWKLRENQRELFEMSQVLTKEAGSKRAKPCECTLTRIEDKIKNGELTDKDAVISACRRLVSFFLITRAEDRKISGRYLKLLQVLRSGAV